MDSLSPEKIIALDPPIDAGGGGKVAELRLREPVAIQVANAEREVARGRSPAAARRRDFVLISLVTGLDIAAVRQIPIGIIIEAAAYLWTFAQYDSESEIDFVMHPKEWEMPISPAISIGPVTYSSLRLREPVGATVEAAEELLAGQGASLRQYQMKLVALAADVLPAVVGRLRIRELDAASHYIQRFISGGPATGES